MPTIITVDGKPVSCDNRSIIEDVIAYLIDFLDREDSPAADAEPDADEEDSDSGDDQSWAEWRPRTPVKALG